MTTPHPIAVHAYVDCVRIWFKRPLAPAEINFLRHKCREIRRHPWPLKFDKRFVERLNLYQPTDECMRWLANRIDAHLSYAEISLDWTFDDEADKEIAEKVVCLTIIKKYHGDQGIRFHKRTRYTAARGAPNLIATYADKPSKITGDRHCLHIDWRISGREALRRAGIQSANDLICFDYREFWRQRLIMREVNLQTLGRMYANRGKPHKRRRPRIVQIGKRKLIYDFDSRFGYLVAHQYQSTQEIVDVFRKEIAINRCLIPIDVDHLLPPHFPDDYANKPPVRPLTC